MTQSGEEDVVETGAEDDEEVDPKLAVLGEPIVGVERIVYDEDTGPGAIPARPLPTPRSMTEAQRAIHDLTHLPYDPGCEICVSNRRPNTQHRNLRHDDQRTIPLMVGDYCFPKHAEDTDTLTVLVVRVFPYKLMMCCVVPGKGRDPSVIQRLARFIKECGLTHFVYRSDREPAITAMFEEAVSITGRSGKKAESTEVSDSSSHAELLDAGHPDGARLADELKISETPHVPSSVEVPHTHTAAPELTHPGESQSNGLAERAVGIFEDHFRTLKSAFEQRLKRRIPTAHPVIAWLAEHTAWVLNKFHLDREGRTAYGRLHGREGKERVCEFGERVMWFVPKKMRSKLDQRWRYGTFLGRSLSSDQNFVATNSGDVVCARAIVRVVANIRWDPERVSKIRVSPMDFKMNTMDRIEEETEPDAHPDPKPDVSDSQRQMRRLRVMDPDVRKHGFTKSCQRCEFLRQGKTLLARGTRHNEECRAHIYEALRAAGVEKLQRADMEGSERTLTRRKNGEANPPTLKPEYAVAHPTTDGPPSEPLVPMEDEDRHNTPHVNEPNDGDDQFAYFQDAYDFHNEVDDALEVDWNGPDLGDAENEAMMSSLVDVLQTIGVPAADAVAFSVRVTKDRSPRSKVHENMYNPTVFEFYGHGTLINASHGIRRNLNVNGLAAFDLRTCKPDGSPWNLSIGADRRLARQIVEETKPTWIIGSPPCTFFSVWNQGINHRKMDPEKVETLRKEAIKHLHFVVGLYKIQLDGGRHFLHEHPAGASSWKDPWVTKIMSHPRVRQVVSDQCEYGLLTPDLDGNPVPAKKPTRWISSSAQMIKRLSKRCSGNHLHQHLVGGRAKAAEDYSLELVTEILRGIRDTADHEEEWGDSTDRDLEQQMITASVMHDVKHSSLAAAYRAEDVKGETEHLSVKCKYKSGRTESTKLKFKDSYRDEYTNEELPLGEVRLAMLDELEYFCDKVWVLVPMEEALNDEDGKVIGSRWVNCNKNDINDPDVRCRLVAQEVNMHNDESFYAATPPLESKRMLFSQFASEQQRNGEALKLGFVDVKKAYFYGVPERSLYVKLPPELGLDKKLVGKLVRCMYGTRDAGAIWEGCYSSCLIDMGFIQGGASPCCFQHPEWKVSVVVHGDDFTALGTAHALDLYEAGMQKRFECKLKGRLGFEKEDLKEMRVLNRIVRITDDALLYEADPRHAEMLVKSFNLEGAKGVVTPGVKQPYEDEDPDAIDTDGATPIRQILAESRRPRTSFENHIL